MIPGGFGGGKLAGVIAAIVVAVWLATGFYTVDTNEQGVELVFGELFETTGEGLNYNFPAPIGEVLLPQVTNINQTNIGFRENGRSATRAVQEESLMLTGDENIIDVQFSVFWKIRDAGRYLFNIRNPDDTVKNAAESAMREIIGQTEFEFARTNGRAEVENQAQELTQAILDPDHEHRDAERRPARLGARRLPRRSGGGRRPRARDQRGDGLFERGDEPGPGPGGAGRAQRGGLQGRADQPGQG
jgi:membrane protease subunit HflK